MRETLFDPPDELRQRHAELCQHIAQHDRLYYIQATPLISDQEYDRLYAELRKIEADYPDLATTDSPTQRVGGGAIEGFRSLPHAVPMQSLDNTYSAADLSAFYQRMKKDLAAEQIPCVVEPKVDGVAISVRYEKGLLSLALTRGDGRKGDDVTANLRTIRSLPMRIASLADCVELRGEVYLRRSTFDRLNAMRRETGQEPFANPRNCAAGSLKLLDPSEVSKRALSVVLYGHGAVEGEPFADHLALFDWMQKMGLPTHRRVWSCQSLEEIQQAIAELDTERAGYDFETDGAVIKATSFAMRQSLGSTAKAPRWAMAFKYAAAQARTKLHAITLQVGRTGVLTPVAELVPVELAGSTVSRATLHNFSELARKDIRVGDTVVVEKAGEVIPAVVEICLSLRPPDTLPYQPPTRCPICPGGGDLVTEDVYIRCTRQDCAGQLKRRLQHFVSRGAMDLEGFGESLIEQLVDRGLVASIPDLYRLDAATLAGLDRMGEKSASNLLAGLEASKSREAWRLLFGLGVLHVGATVARLLCDRFGSLQGIASACLDELTSVEGVGEVVAASVRAYFDLPQTSLLLQQLDAAGVCPPPPPPPTAEDTSLLGLSFVLTGSLSRPREDVATWIRKRGGRVLSAVSAKTNFLVAGSGGGSKLDKATSLGVVILNEDELEKLAHPKSPPTVKQDA